MKKLLLFVIIIMSGHAAFCQMSVFMKMIENKMICNKEDQLTYFLQANGYERQSGNNYLHNYTEGHEAFYTAIVNENECYALYRTNNLKDYNRIKNTITGKCAREYAADKSMCYVCNAMKVQDVQIIFTGYLQASQSYEIKIFQNPNPHKLPYAQSDRAAAGYDY